MSSCTHNPSMKSSAVSSENQTRLSPWVGRAVKGARFLGVHLDPVTACPTPHNGARNEAKRGSVELRSMVEGFCFCFCRVPFARLGEFQTGGKNRQTYR